MSTITRDIFDIDAKKVSSIALPDSLFNAPWNPNLVHDVFLAMEANARTPVAHTKTRGEVRGGGKKPWKQKGTGRARHGSRRSPIWVGGGITHGPRNDRDFSKKVNKKAKQAALKSLLSQKLRENEVVFLNEVSFTAPKTKSAREMMTKLAKIEGFEKIGKGQKNSVLFVLPESAENFEKSIRNFGNVDVVDARNLDVRDLLSYQYALIVSPDTVVASLEERLTTREKVTA